MDTHTVRCDLAGRELIIETGRFAMQADAAVTVRYGDTLVLSTMCYARSVREGVDFLPLTIEFEERLYAAGKIPGGFLRREGRPSEAAILACRQTDRPIRPLLPKTWRSEIQIITTVLSADQENDPDILSVIGASMCLHMSEIPFDGPIGAVNLGFINGELVVNPKMAQADQSDLDLVVVSTRDKIIMVEAGANEVDEETVLGAVRHAHEVNQSIIKLQDELREKVGKPKLPVPVSSLNTDLQSDVNEIIGDRFRDVIREKDRPTRTAMRTAIGEEVCRKLAEKHPEKERDVLAAVDNKWKYELRNAVLDRNERIAGRAITEIRPLSCDVGLLPRVHGSGLFQRGQTQVLSIATLGSTRKEQMIDGIGLEESKHFMHHYNFPGFSTGEVRRVGGTSRREVGHGALAERALAPMLPPVEEFPYAIRLVAEVLSSNGSTSMASVCAGSLALMDAGIPVRKPVAGVAMGLITDDDGRFVVLTDLEGQEDFNGDMDFKIAGTREGITAIQMDTKLKGLTMEIVEQTFHQALEGRLFVLDTMNKVISQSREEVSPYAPRMTKIKVDPAKIGAIIGSGGKTIRSIIEETKTSIDVEDDGTVVIGSPDGEATRKAIAIIEGLTRDAQIGDMFTGKVSRILDFGAMVEILPGKEGLVHISELADHRVGKVEDEVKVGDEVTVKVIAVDNLGRVNLSRRAVFEEGTEQAAAREEARQERRSSRPRFNDRDRRSNRGPSRPPRR